jgi:citronellol/citronellal dehydrogenase
MSANDRFQSVFRPGLFDASVILVTGGGTGIGRCTAHELAALGATVVIGGRRREVLDATAEEIAAAGGKCDVVELDIRKEDAVDAAVAAVVGKHGRIDGLFNNAGGQFFALAENLSPNAWRSVVDLNLNGTFLVSSAVFRHSMREHGGSIVNMLADIWTGYPAMAHMSAARAGIENMAVTLSLEWARHGVRVNCVAPGTIMSSGIVTYPEEVQKRTATEAMEAPSGRLGTESEVSAAVVFLLSPAASYVTGDTLKIDGGARFQKGRFIRFEAHSKMKRFDGFHLRPDFTGTPFEEI